MDEYTKIMRRIADALESGGYPALSESADGIRHNLELFRKQTVLSAALTAASKTHYEGESEDALFDRAKRFHDWIIKTDGWGE